MRISLELLGAPYCLTHGFYFYTPPKRSNERRRLEKEYLNEVINWLEEISEKYGINLEIQYNDKEVRAYYNNEEVFYFYIYLSTSRYYKKQNTTSLIRLIKNSYAINKNKEIENVSYNITSNIK